MNIKNNPLYNHLIQDKKNCARMMDEAIELNDYHAAADWKVLYDYIRELARKVASGQFENKGEKEA